MTQPGTDNLEGWAARSTLIECIPHPEWGQWGIAERNDNAGWFKIRNSRGDRILNFAEARDHWRKVDD